MKVSRNTTLILLVAILAPTLAIAIPIGIGNQSTVTVSQSSILNTPFQVVYNGFEVRDGASNAFIATVAAGNQFTDATHVYPKIDAYFSQPFLVTASGQYTSTAPSEYLDAIGTVVVDGTVYYVHKIRYGVDVGARTSGNMKSPGDTTSILAPFAGFTHSHAGGSYTFKRVDFTNPSLSVGGVLAGYVDTGVSPWAGHLAPANAKITSSLEMIDYYIGSESSRVTSNTYASAVTKLSSKWGNSKINVYPRFTLVSKPDFFTTPYEFTATVGGENVTVTVTPATTQCGFEDAYKITSFDRKGSITNTLHADLAAANISTIIPTTTITSTSSRDTSSDEFEQNPGYVNTKTITGGIEFLSSDDDALTGWSETFATITSNLTMPASVVSVDESTKQVFNNYQKGLQITTGNALAPVSILSTATMRVNWQMRFWDGAWAGGMEDTEEAGYQDILVPYKLVQTNTYSQQRVIIETVVLTSAGISMLSASGEPIDPSTFTDYQLNSIIRDPTRDVVKQDAELSYFDWLRFINDLFTGSIPWVIIGIIAVVVIVILVIKRKFTLPPTQGGAGKNRRSWSIGGKKGITYSEA